MARLNLEDMETEQGRRQRELAAIGDMLTARLGSYPDRKAIMDEFNSLQRRGLSLTGYVRGK